MVDRETRRKAAIVAMADHLLATGLKGASLRPMAVAAGTSDRMLLYYFADKEELLAATLAEIAGRMVPVLGASVGPAPQPPERLLAEIVAAVGGSALQPFMQLWLELAARGGARRAALPRNRRSDRGRLLGLDRLPPRDRVRCGPIRRGDTAFGADRRRGRVERRRARRCRGCGNAGLNSSDAVRLNDTRRPTASSSAEGSSSPPFKPSRSMAAADYGGLQTAASTDLKSKNSVLGRMAAPDDDAQCRRTSRL